VPSLSLVSTNDISGRWRPFLFSPLPLPSSLAREFPISIARSQGSLDSRIFLSSGRKKNTERGSPFFFPFFFLSCSFDRFNTASTCVQAKGISMDGRFPATPLPSPSPPFFSDVASHESVGRGRSPPLPFRDLQGARGVRSRVAGSIVGHPFSSFPPCSLPLPSPARPLFARQNKHHRRSVAGAGLLSFLFFFPLLPGFRHGEAKQNSAW